jgi:signal transduction histidine kinase
VVTFRVRRLAWLVRFAIYALVGVLTFVTQPPGATAVRAQLAGYVVAGVALVACTVLAARRPCDDSWALPALAVVLSAASGFTAGAGQHENNCAILIASMAAAGAAYRFSPRTAWLVTAAGIAAFEVDILIYGDGVNQLSTFLLQPLGPLSGLMLGMLVRAREIQREQSTALLAEQHRADVLGERARIAREIHDVLAHSLGALGIQIQTARAMLTDQGDMLKAVDMLMAAQKMAADGLHETRRAVHALRADLRQLDTELGVVVGTHRERYHVGVNFDVSGVPRPVSPEGTLALLRTAQEALMNAAKHAWGEDVTMRLDYADRDVRLTVVNPLSARHAQAPGTINGGYGLTGMRERLRLLNGTLDAGPCDGRWTVDASLPLAAA